MLLILSLWADVYLSYAVVQEPQQLVSSIPGLFSQSDLVDKPVDTFDVIVCGGTLGIFIATALSFKGLRVAVVERNILKGVYCIVKFIIKKDIFIKQNMLKLLGVLTDAIPF